jgi:hypothetical protein
LYVIVNFMPESSVASGLSDASGLVESSGFAVDETDGSSVGLSVKPSTGLALEPQAERESIVAMPRRAALVRILFERLIAFGNIGFFLLDWDAV